MDEPNLDDILAKQAPPTKTVELCLRGDLQSQWEDLNRQLEEEHKGARGSLAGSSARARELSERIVALEAEMKAATVAFRLRGLGRRKWTELEAKYPPRKDNEADRFYGFHTDAIFDEAIPLCLESPSIEPDKLAEVLDNLTSGQYDELAVATLELNKKASRVPFSLTASLITKASAVMSKRPSDSESPTAGSMAGSLES